MQAMSGSLYYAKELTNKRLEELGFRLPKQPPNSWQLWARHCREQGVKFSPEAWASLPQEEQAYWRERGQAQRDAYQAAKLEVVRQAAPQLRVSHWAGRARNAHSLFAQQVWGDPALKEELSKTAARDVPIAIFAGFSSLSPDQSAAYAQAATTDLSLHKAYRKRLREVHPELPKATGAKLSGEQARAVEADAECASLLERMEQLPATLPQLQPRTTALMLQKLRELQQAAQARATDEVAAAETMAALAAGEPGGAPAWDEAVEAGPAAPERLDKKAGVAATAEAGQCQEAAEMAAAPAASIAGPGASPAQQPQQQRRQRQRALKRRRKEPPQAETAAGEAGASGEGRQACPWASPRPALPVFDLRDMENEAEEGPEQAQKQQQPPPLLPPQQKQQDGEAAVRLGAAKPHAGPKRKAAAADATAMGEAVGEAAGSIAQAKRRRGRSAGLAPASLGELPAAQQPLQRGGQTGREEAAPAPQQPCPPALTQPAGPAPSHAAQRPAQPDAVGPSPAEADALGTLAATPLPEAAAAPAQPCEPAAGPSAAQVAKDPRLVVLGLRKRQAAALQPRQPTAEPAAAIPSRSEAAPVAATAAVAAPAAGEAGPKPRRSACSASLGQQGIAPKAAAEAEAPQAASAPKALPKVLTSFPHLLKALLAASERPAPTTALHPAAPAAVLAPAEPSLPAPVAALTAPRAPMVAGGAEPLSTGQPAEQRACPQVQEAAAAAAAAAPQQSPPQSPSAGGFEGFANEGSPAQQPGPSPAKPPPPLPPAAPPIAEGDGSSRPEGGAGDAIVHAVLPQPGSSPGMPKAGQAGAKRRRADCGGSQRPPEPAGQGAAVPLKAAQPPGAAAASAARAAAGREEAIAAAAATASRVPSPQPPPAATAAAAEAAAGLQVVDLTGQGIESEPVQRRGAPAEFQEDSWCRCVGETPFDATAESRPTYRQLLALLGRAEHAVPADGNCQMHAISFDRLVRSGAAPEGITPELLAAEAQGLRRRIAAALRGNPMLRALAGGAGAAAQLAERVEGMARSCGDVSRWGGGLSARAAAVALGADIFIINAQRPFLSLSWYPGSDSLVTGSDSLPFPSGPSGRGYPPSLFDPASILLAYDGLCHFDAVAPPAAGPSVALPAEAPLRAALEAGFEVDPDPCRLAAAAVMAQRVEGKRARAELRGTQQAELQRGEEGLLAATPPALPLAPEELLQQQQQQATAAVPALPQTSNVSLSAAAGSSLQGAASAAVPPEQQAAQASLQHQPAPQQQQQSQPQPQPPTSGAAAPAWEPAPAASQARQGPSSVCLPALPPPLLLQRPLQGGPVAKGGHGSWRSADLATPKQEGEQQLGEGQRCTSSEREDPACLSSNRGSLAPSLPRQAQQGSDKSGASSGRAAAHPTKPLAIAVAAAVAAYAAAGPAPAASGAHSGGASLPAGQPGGQLCAAQPAVSTLEDSERTATEGSPAALLCPRSEGGAEPCSTAVAAAVVAAEPPEVMALAPDGTASPQLPLRSPPRPQQPVATACTAKAGSALCPSPAPSLQSPESCRPWTHLSLPSPPSCALGLSPPGEASSEGTPASPLRRPLVLPSPPTSCRAPPALSPPCLQQEAERVAAAVVAAAVAATSPAEQPVLPPSRGPGQAPAASLAAQRLPFGSALPSPATRAAAGAAVAVGCSSQVPNQLPPTNAACTAAEALPAHGQQAALEASGGTVIGVPAGHLSWDQGGGFMALMGQGLPAGASAELLQQGQLGQQGAHPPAAGHPPVSPALQLQLPPQLLQGLMAAAGGEGQALAACGAWAAGGSEPSVQGPSSLSLQHQHQLYLQQALQRRRPQQQQGALGRQQVVATAALHQAAALGEAAAEDGMRALSRTQWQRGSTWAAAALARAQHNASSPKPGTAAQRGRGRGRGGGGPTGRKPGRPPSRLGRPLGAGQGGAPSGAPPAAALQPAAARGGGLGSSQPEARAPTQDWDPWAAGAVPVTEAVLPPQAPAPPSPATSAAAAAAGAAAVAAALAQKIREHGAAALEAIKAAKAAEADVWLAEDRHVEAMLRHMGGGETGLSGGSSDGGGGGSRGPTGEAGPPAAAAAGSAGPEAGVVWSELDAAGDTLVLARQLCRARMAEAQIAVARTERLKAAYQFWLQKTGMGAKAGPGAGPAVTPGPEAWGALIAQGLPALG